MRKQKDLPEVPAEYAVPMTKDQKRELLTYELIGQIGGGMVIPLMPPPAEERKPGD